MSEGNPASVWLSRATDGDRITVAGFNFTFQMQVLQQHHGAINKYLGDGFLAYWPTGPQAAAWVAHALRDFKGLQDRADPLFRVVVHYGTVSAGGTPSMGVQRSLNTLAK